ncbi:hypothetical protein QJS10_CPA09g00984 [Acorus calamus]|uniref:Uncharacterized protein n=1 Tax=Acorus calamus TaxID=4465 RepID=A0AAV9E3M7_ACOCL|nr:hypothetical protein QJS10_CPA09g00984 [Acorus calamus]
MAVEASFEGVGQAAKEGRGKRKQDLLSVIATINLEEENGAVNGAARSNKIAAKSELENLLKQEELEWHQKSKALWLKASDSNTKYFHKAASQRRRINKISSLNMGNRVVESVEEIGRCLVEHFKMAFKKDKRWRHMWFDEDLPRLP